MPAAHPPVEEYLQAIAFLTEEGGPTIQARLAERLKKTPATVSEIVIRLEANGHLVRHGRTITLTESGRAIADGVIRRHRLAERLLVDIVGLPWSSAHHEASQFEHILSTEVEARVVKLLDDPATCPHGNPIPGGRPVRPKVTVMPLSTVPSGQVIRLERVPEDVEDQDDVLRYLEDAGFLPGALATVGVIGPEGTLSLAVGDRHLALGQPLAARLFVSIVTPTFEQVATTTRAAGPAPEGAEHRSRATMARRPR